MLTRAETPVDVALEALAVIVVAEAVNETVLVAVCVLDLHSVRHV